MGKVCWGTGHLYSFKYFPPKYLLITKGKQSKFRMEKPDNKQLKQINDQNKHQSIKTISLLIFYTKKTTSLLMYSCQKLIWRNVKPKLREILQNNWPISTKGQGKKGKRCYLKNKTCQINAVRLFCYQRHNWEDGQNLNEVHALVSLIKQLYCGYVRVSLS